MDNPNIDDLVLKVTQSFHSFGGGQGGSFLADALKDEEPSFGAGVSIRDVVEFVLTEDNKCEDEVYTEDLRYVELSYKEIFARHWEEGLDINIWYIAEGGDPDITRVYSESAVRLYMNEHEFEARCKNY